MPLRVKKIQPWYKKLPRLIPSLVLLLLIVGLGATYILAKIPQDLRQQAYFQSPMCTANTCDPRGKWCNSHGLITNTRCSARNPDNCRDGIQQGECRSGYRCINGRFVADGSCASNTQPLPTDPPTTECTANTCDAGSRRWCGSDSKLTSIVCSARNPDNCAGNVRQGECVGLQRCINGRLRNDSACTNGYSIVVNGTGVAGCVPCEGSNQCAYLSPRDCERAAQINNESRGIN